MCKLTYTYTHVSYLKTLDVEVKAQSVDDHSSSFPQRLCTAGAQLLRTH